MNKETLKFYDGGKYIINPDRINNGKIIGMSLYNSDMDSKEDFNFKEISHVVRGLNVLDQDGNYELTIEFLDNEHGRKAKEAYELIKSGKHGGYIAPSVVSSCGSIIRIDMSYDYVKCESTECTHIQEKRKEYTTDQLRDLFKYINDDMKVLELCAQYKNYVEIMNDNDGSWVQIIDGTDSDDVLYDFRSDFGNRDGILNLFKMLNINAKLV